MVSHSETFGLVYLEALSQGCLSFIQRSKALTVFLKSWKSATGRFKKHSNIMENIQKVIENYHFLQKNIAIYLFHNLNGKILQCNIMIYTKAYLAKNVFLPIVVNFDFTKLQKWDGWNSFPYFIIFYRTTMNNNMLPTISIICPVYNEEIHCKLYDLLFHATTRPH